MLRSMLFQLAICLLPIVTVESTANIVPKRPNILFVLTDDQDWHMESLQHMPLLQKYLINEGTLYANHHCTVAICCPSRVNLWTGRAAHNTNVTDLFPPYGGYPKVVREGINENYLPVWMQQAGYNTYYSGKLWNAHNVDNYDKPYVRGFTGSDFLVDPYTYEYYNSSMVRNGAAPASYEGQYSPDIVAQKAYDFLDEAAMHKEPWFLTVAPVAPHSNCHYKCSGELQVDPPKYAERHAHLFNDYIIPRTDNFNPEKFTTKHNGVSWMKDLPLLNSTVIKYNDEFQRSRLRALQSVDEMVATLIQKLSDKGELDNTYIFYTTDNGYHISQHRLHPGKECGYDTDIHIPLIVRGPGVAAGRVAEPMTSHTDLAPTILGLAGTTRDDFDGLAIPLSSEETGSLDSTRFEHVNIEFWGKALPEGRWGKYGDVPDANLGISNAATNNTYKGLRIVSPEYNLYYSVWCTGEKEYYDVKLDPGQLDNYFLDASLLSDYSIAGRPFDQVVRRLDTLMMVLKSCKTHECTDPWSVLHPAGNVKTLKDAMEESYDAFYEGQPKVEYNSCQLGYIKEEEGPQLANIFDGHHLDHDGHRQTFRYQGPWSVWT